MDIWVAMGFYSVIFYGALLDISDDILEAARIDGCVDGSYLKIFFLRFFVRW